MRLLHPVLEEVKITLETCQPGASAGADPSEVFIVTFLPYAPGGYDEDIHEHWPAPRVFSCMQELHPVAMQRPRDPQLPPTCATEIAAEE